MKAISLWQPWASAIALGSKRIETRSWPTSYRGPLAIHAAKRCVKTELISMGSDWEWRGALAAVLDGDQPLWKVLPFGAIVAVCRLADCRKTESFTVGELDERHKPLWAVGSVRNWGGEWTERQMGDFYPGRWGWVLEDVQPLAVPLPYKGEQGLFDVPDDLIGNPAEVRMEMPGRAPVNGFLFSA